MAELQHCSAIYSCLLWGNNSVLCIVLMKTDLTDLIGRDPNSAFKRAQDKTEIFESPFEQCYLVQEKPDTVCLRGAILPWQNWHASECRNQAFILPCDLLAAFRQQCWGGEVVSATPARAVRKICSECCHEQIWHNSNAAVTVYIVRDLSNNNSSREEPVSITSTH